MTGIGCMHCPLSPYPGLCIYPPCTLLAPFWRQLSVFSYATTSTRTAGVLCWNIPSACTHHGCYRAAKPEQDWAIPCPNMQISLSKVIRSVWSIGTKYFFRGLCASAGSWGDPDAHETSWFTWGFFSVCFSAELLPCVSRFTRYLPSYDVEEFRFRVHPCEDTN